MANETSYATLVSNGGRLSSILSDMWHENLYDPTDLRALMVYRPMVAGPSATMSTPSVSSFGAAAAASSEISGGASNTLLSTGKFDLTVARYLKKLQPTDLFAMTSQGSAINLELLFAQLTKTVGLTMTDLLCALFPSVASNVGTSGVNMSVQDWFSAAFALNLQSNGGRIAAVLHGQQFNDFQDSLRGETGPLQWVDATAEMLMLRGSGYKGSFMGVEVWQSDSVPTANAGADRQGCMFSQGAFGYTFGDVRPIVAQMINPADILVQTPELFIERSRDAANGMTSLLLNIYPGVVEQEDLRAVTITTDA